MRTKFSLALLLLVLTAWAVAEQQSTTSPGAPAQGSTQTTPQPGEPGQATPSTPAAPSAGGQMAASGEPDVIEGCLGGAAPNFTVTDASGKAYNLNIPAGADLSVLTRHVGESVQVMGAVSDGAAAGATASDAKSKGGATIAVQKIGRGKSSCPAGGAGAGATKPPTK